MLSNYKNKAIASENTKTKQQFAFPDRDGIPAFACEAETIDEAHVLYEQFKRSLIPND